MDDLKKLIREVPDFPKPGILFYDITTLLKNKAGLRTTIDRLTEMVAPTQPDIVIGIEARGFIFAPALAYHLGPASCLCASPRNCLGDREDQLRTRVRSRHSRSPQGCDLEGNAGPHRR